MKWFFFYQKICSSRLFTRRGYIQAGEETFKERENFKILIMS